MSSKSRKFPCPVEGCLKAYNRPSVLDEHLRSHTDTRPFACDQCDKKFLRESHLKSHQWIHADERPLGCDHCEKRFITKQQLQRHSRVHDKKRVKLGYKPPESPFRWKWENGKPNYNYPKDAMPSPLCPNSQLQQSPESDTTSTTTTTTANGSSRNSSTTTATTVTSSEQSDSHALETGEIHVCPYDCNTILPSSKELTDHMLATHIFNDTINVDTHLDTLKHKMHTKDQHWDLLSEWDGSDWSQKLCMEVECQGYGCPGYNDFESLVAHYNDSHGFVPESLFEFINLDGL
ncbi:Zinc finger protein FZF1 [Cyberlindnera fabianii]|uniref:Zinc finger protein FZF1 n=1 Tax=Cyberlindnera fabianii TaxID=36022 RepID=A0A1V2KZL3_CYBFA|nr:Zinc finger protein FZF1 [Cyberlindnera fabianii]